MAWDDGLDKNSVVYAIAAAPDPRVRVIAGPGTGKSFATKRRVAKLLESGIKPSKILAVTFTRVAAEDLHRELQKLKTPGSDQLEGQTLHSLAMRILRRKHVLEALGRSPRPLNRFEIKAMLCDLCGDNGGKRQCAKFIKAYEAAWARSQGDEPGFAKTAEEKNFQADLLDWLNFHEAMLIGELIPYLVKFLKDNPGAPEHAEFSHLLIDEYQDLNKAEQTALAYLGQGAEVCIVGDDDQSIYSFKCAHPDGIREWKKENGGCADHEMAECRRCPTRVVEMANALISHNKNREPRALKPINENGAGDVAIVQLADLDAEASYIAKTVSGLLKKGVHPSEVIILVQRSIAAKPIIAALKENGVPAKSYYDESQLDSELAQQRFALFKLLLDAEDRVALRYLLGVGTADFRASSYARVQAHCEESGDSPWSALEKLQAGALKIPYSKALIAEFGEIKAALDALKAQIGDIAAFVDLLFPDGEADLTDLRELALRFLEVSDGPEDLLDFMMDEITQPDVPPVVEEVRLMSLHKSKGLSSPFVIIAGCVQGILPPLPEKGIPKAQAAAELEEARRLFYVGITRVKSDPAADRPGTLLLTYPQQMPVAQAYGAGVAFASKTGAMANLIPSVFIGELGPGAPKPKKA